MFPTLTGIMAPPSGVIQDNRWGVLGIPGTMWAERSINRDSLILYVDSTHASGSDLNDGADPQHPLVTLKAAIAKCVANRGDVIYVYPTHTETFTTAGQLNINIAGVTILGLGTGENRPTIVLGAVAGSVTVNAANVLISGMIFKAGFAAVTNLVSCVAAKDVWFDTCEFRDGGTTLVALTYLNLTGTANSNDRAIVNNCVFRSIVVGANQAVEIGAIQERVLMERCKIYGDYLVAGVHSGSVLANIRMSSNEIRNTHAAKWAIQFTAAATGVLVNNELFSDGAATCLNPGSCFCAGNMAAFAINTAGVAIPAISGAQVPDVIATRATEALPQTTSKTLFTIVGGPILIKQIFGTITTAIGAVANATKLYVGTPGATDICATVELNNAALDGRLSITGTFANAMVKTLTGIPLTAGQATPIVAPSGNIGVNCAGSDGGNGRVRWTLVYQPLEAGAYVTMP